MTNGYVSHGGGVMRHQKVRQGSLYEENEEREMENVSYTVYTRTSKRKKNKRKTKEKHSFLLEKLCIV